MRSQVQMNTTSKFISACQIIFIMVIFIGLILLMNWGFMKLITIEKKVEIITAPIETEEVTYQEPEPETVVIYETVPVEIIETRYLYDTQYVYIDVIPDDYDWYKKKYAELVAALQQKQEIPDVDKLNTPYNSSYPTAEKVWVYMTQELHYSDYIAAAIIGNMMVECGGMTLNLKWDLQFSDGEYYGLCQWAKRWFPDIHGKSILTQLEYLYKTMPYEFKTFGRLYKSGFTLEEFLGMEDCREAALAFAQIYERCGEGSYTKRQKCAVQAYEYFTKLAAEVGN